MKMSRVSGYVLVGLLICSHGSSFSMIEGFRSGTSKEMAVAVTAILAAIIAELYVMKGIKQLVINNGVKKLREKFPDFKEASLKIGALAGIGGLGVFIHNTAAGKIVRLSNPFKALKDIAADPENIAAIAEATHLQPDHVKNMLENASYRTIMVPQK